jgi:cytidine deaminase
MMEFCDPATFQIILGTGEADVCAYTLEELLPLGFGPKNLENC